MKRKIKLRGGVHKRRSQGAEGRSSLIKESHRVMAGGWDVKIFRRKASGLPDEVKKGLSCSTLVVAYGIWLPVAVQSPGRVLLPAPPGLQQARPPRPSPSPRVHQDTELWRGFGSSNYFSNWEDMNDKGTVSAVGL
ncbi:uncharacterized protein LOC129631575 isoform X4 [Bubalus kerabau]|uniref:uncharacterized protein LOC129631575 isoform X4 n=1 Tax=Bubalus carabanensis TaxID=3119969 RepID=UPI00244ED589|nr:uncharacterized protein LOC129631575 isoform X4 [Bubalus carabanensis]